MHGHEDESAVGSARESESRARGAVPPRRCPGAFCDTWEVIEENLERRAARRAKARRLAAAADRAFAAAGGSGVARGRLHPRDDPRASAEERKAAAAMAAGASTDEAGEEAEFLADEWRDDAAGNPNPDDDVFRGAHADDSSSDDDGDDPNGNTKRRGKRNGAGAVSLSTAFRVPVWIVAVVVRGRVVRVRAAEDVIVGVGVPRGVVAPLVREKFRLFSRLVRRRARGHRRGGFPLLGTRARIVAGVESSSCHPRPSRGGERAVRGGGEPSRFRSPRRSTLEILLDNLPCIAERPGTASRWHRAASAALTFSSTPDGTFVFVSVHWTEK